MTHMERIELSILNREQWEYIISIIEQKEIKNEIDKSLLNKGYALLNQTDDLINGILINLNFDIFYCKITRNMYSNTYTIWINEKHSEVETDIKEAIDNLKNTYGYCEKAKRANIYTTISDFKSFKLPSNELLLFDNENKEHKEKAINIIRSKH